MNIDEILVKLGKQYANDDQIWVGHNYSRADLLADLNSVRRKLNAVQSATESSESE